MVSTKDRRKVGQITYRVAIQKWNEDNTDYSNPWQDEVRTFEEAESAVRAKLVEFKADSGTIYEGEYEASEFEDNEYGMVYDAEWRENSVQWDLYAVDGEITIEKSEW